MAYEPLIVKNKERVVIFDLEGTLSDCSARIHHYEKKEYDAWNEEFLNDPINEKTAGLLRGYVQCGTKIIICTAKNVGHKADVEKWLAKNDLLKKICDIFYRGKLDSRSAITVKRDMLRIIEDKYTVAAAYDDREDICEMYTRNGVESLLVKPDEKSEKAHQILSRLSDLHKTKNEEYGNGYLEFGKIFMGLFPNGVKLETESDFTRFGALNIMVSKLDRYCKNFTKGGHSDSLDDLSVYTAMLREIDNGVK